MEDSLILDNLNNLRQSSINRKRSTRLTHTEVSIKVKQSMESDWISASESLLE